MKGRLLITSWSAEGCIICQTEELHLLIVHVGLDHGVLLNELAKGVDILLILPVYFHHFLLGLQAVELKTGTLRMNTCVSTPGMEP